MKKLSKPRARSATGRLRGPGRPAEPSRPEPAERVSFPVVGLGASAGGLEALESFLKNVPPKSGMAFVVVQHLDPTHKGMLVELLQRATRDAGRPDQGPDEGRRRTASMSIPPNKDLSILHGVLHLLQPAAPRGLRLPIDFFFRSLAEDQQDRAIGVILSGMGSDGTLGIAGHQGEGRRGLRAGARPRPSSTACPAAPSTPGSPTSSRRSRSCPRRILDLPARTLPLMAKPEAALHEKDAERAGKDRRCCCARRPATTSPSTREHHLPPHRAAHGPPPARPHRRLRPVPAGEPQGDRALFKELLIGVTSFFRDPAAWDQLRDEALPALAERAPATRDVLRAWTPAARPGKRPIPWPWSSRRRSTRSKPHKSGLAADLRDRPGQGRHRQGPAGHLSGQHRRGRFGGTAARFFVKDERGYRVGKEIREMVIFAPQNLVMDPPFTKLDLLTCRNLLIYLDAGAAEEAHAALSLQPESRRHADSGQRGDRRHGDRSLRAARRARARLYRRLRDARPHAESRRIPRGVHPQRSCGRSLIRAGPRPAPPAPNLQALADQLLLQRYSPAAVLVTNEGRHPLHQRQDRQVSRAARPARPTGTSLPWPARGCGYALSEAFSKAVRRKRRSRVHGVKVGHERRHAGRRRHRPGARRARRRCGGWSWSCSPTWPSVRRQSPPGEAGPGDRSQQPAGRE